MNQATALRLQQGLKEQEGELEQCYIRMEKGEPPSDEMERDWLKLLRDEERRIMEHEHRRLVSGIAWSIRALDEMRKISFNRHYLVYFYTKS